MSSESESDEDYTPGEPEQLSEEESADEETDKQYDKELEHKTKKRKATKAGKVISTKKTKRTRQSKNEVEDINEKKCENVSDETVDPEEEKKHEEDLWAKFLEGTDTKPKAVPKETNNVQSSPIDNVQTKKDSSIIDNKHKSNNQKNKERERKIFEFAGEKIVVENNVIKEKIKLDDKPSTGTNLANCTGSPNIGKPSSSSKSAVSNILGQINKKSKLSTLEKSKLDWVTFKQEEGIEEEIQSHNKGKQGFLERRDFLERADMRQYEIERDLKMSRRSNR